MTSAVQPRIDARLLARMTGQLGDRKTIAGIVTAIGEAICAPLTQKIFQATAIKLDCSLAGATEGTRAEMAAPFDGKSALCETTLTEWSDDVVLACDGGLVIAATERLLGGTGAAKSAARPLSDIERDVAFVLFEAFASALGTTVGATGHECGFAFDGPLKRESDAREDAYAATLRLLVELDGRTYALQAVLPQDMLLKTVIQKPGAPEGTSQRAPKWVEQLTHKVHMSHVTMQANVALAPVTLSAASRLQPGDVLPFADEKDVRVLLKANGKDLYWCEFGKAGNRYMLRLQDRYGSEEDFIRQLTG
ncbi:FliM/FliN family flagellar motor switch protein [Pararhizobium haloflavum]|uniref:FliM/FliN family flagellar motor switch protein n=1 Tax=Pararhizobium haloflavum TaxID=2037914 RepID=UPI0013001057|nr:FliM/FliN family flagellar motor switch protein [Pararhizobium haloflavum]